LVPGYGATTGAVSFAGAGGTAGGGLGDGVTAFGNGTSLLASFCTVACLHPATASNSAAIETVFEFMSIISSRNRVRGGSFVSPT